MTIWKWAAITGAAACSMAFSSPASAQNVERASYIAQCNNGSGNSCLSAAMAFEDIEDPENPEQTLIYSKRACDRNVRNGCLYYAMTNLRAGLYLHQRIISTALDGDPKGEWTLKTQLNAAIDRARNYYTTARSVDASISDDWDDKLQSLERLRQ